MAVITIRSECPDCGKRIKLTAEANSEVRGQCPRCGCWMKIPVGSVGAPEPKGNGPDSAESLLAEKSSARPGPLSAPPPLPPRAVATMPPAPAPPIPTPPSRRSPVAAPQTPKPTAPRPPRSAPALKAVAVPKTPATPPGGPSPAAEPSAPAGFWSRRGLSLGIVAASLVGMAVAGWILTHRNDSGVAQASDEPGPTTIQVAGDDTPPQGADADPADDPSGSSGTLQVAAGSDNSDGRRSSGGSGSAPDKAIVAPGERYALLVSVRDYHEETTGLTSLRFTERDVEELAEVLKKTGYQEHNVVVMSQSVAVKQFHLAPERIRILEQLDRLVDNRSEGDTILVAFAGHGIKLRGSDDSYFCPLGTNLDDPNTLISYREVYDKLANSGAGFKLLLSDACRDEPLAKSSRSTRRATVDLDSVTRPPAPPKLGGIAALFACSPGEFAYEHTDINHGVFFHFVIKGLRGEADFYDKDGIKDGIVTLKELELYVGKQVPDFVSAKFPRKQQIPHFQSDVKGQFALVTLPKEPLVSPPTEKMPDPAGAGNAVADASGAPADATPPDDLPPGETPDADGPPTGIPPGGPIGELLSPEEVLAKNRLPDGDYPPMVEVPKVTGQTVARAREMLHAAGLGLDFKLGQDSDLVGNQNPYAGKVVASRSVVTLGNLKARVPNVVGMKYSEAAKLLQDLHGFKVISALSVENDLVITDQQPASGLFKQRGTQVNIQHMVPVPDVTAFDVDTAVRRLKEAGFQVEVQTQYVAGDPVYAQFPRNKVAVGSEIRITPGVVVPNVVNMTTTQAELTLSRVGITPRLGAFTRVKGPPGEPVVRSQGVAPTRVMSRKEQLLLDVIQYVR